MGLMLANRALWTPGRQLKPAGVPRINWSHPLAQDLICYFFDTGDDIVELVRGWPRTINGSPVTFGSMSPYGPALKWNGVQDTSISFNTSGRDPRLRTLGAKGFAFACAIFQTAEAATNSTTSATEGGIFGRFHNDGNSGSDSMLWWGVLDYRVAAGDHQIVAALADSTGGVARWLGAWRPTQWTGQSVLNVYHTITCSMSNSTDGFTWGDGGLQIGGGAAAFSPGYTPHDGTDTADHIVFGNKTSSTSNATNADIPFAGGYIYWGAAWDRSLSSEEANILHNDPYCFLLPSNEPIPELIFLPPSNLLSVSYADSSPAFVTPTMAVQVPMATSALAVPSPAVGTATYVVLWMADRVIDGGLAVLDNEVNEIWLVSALPVAPTYADAVAAKLGSVATTFGAISTVAAGRRVATPAITAGVCTAVGAAHRWAAVDTVNSRLLAYGQLKGDLTTDTARPWQLDPIAIVKGF